VFLFFILGALKNRILNLTFVKEVIYISYLSQLKKQAASTQKLAS